MPLFYNLDRYGQDAGRVAGRIVELRHTLQNHPDGTERSVPDKNATDTLLLATWNLKEFEGGRNDKRIDESYGAGGRDQGAGKISHNRSEDETA